MHTRSLRKSEIEKKWWIVDATDLVLGRLASLIAYRLKGKHKPSYTPNLDCGDNIIVINAEKVRLTGRKAENEKFYWHTGYPGGIKSQTLKQRMEGAHPERVIYKAVERMLSKGPLRNDLMRNLRIFKGAEHPHGGQNPETWDVGSLNRKNKV